MSGRKCDISSLPIKQQEEILRIVGEKPNRMVDISGLDEDLQHEINKVLLSKEINLVRQGLKELKKRKDG
jgi:hypothetical protein